MMMAVKFLAVAASFLLVGAAYAQQTSDPAAVPPENAEQHNIVVLRALDKITARITELEIEVGKTIPFGTLEITARYCRTRPPIEPPETFGYVQIDDVKRNGDRDRVFDGWMVASSPALNALEHSVYDVWVINCKMPEIGSSSERAK